MSLRSLTAFLSPTICCILFILLTITAFSQTDRGIITGNIVDQQSAFVPNAIVIATNLDTGVKYQSVSTSTGNYTLASLPVGGYELRVEATGFKKFLQKGITVQL